jgi:hypothetical protein
MLRRILLGCGVITTSDLDEVTLATATIRNIDSRTEQEHKIPKMKMFFTALQRVKHTSISISIPSTAHPCIVF